MPLTPRKTLLVVLPVVLATSACTTRPAPFDVKDRSVRADREAPFDPPRAYPEWAYDQPEYVRPTAELAPEPRVKKGEPLHYFTNEKLVMIRQPAGYTPEEIPRVALWWTDNNGFHWHLAGFFGRQQRYFPFDVEEDGDYGIRFIGPGQTPATHTPAFPERVYHVDTVAPEVNIAIDPEQSRYHVGQTIAISWRAVDYHLEDTPTAIKMLLDFTADEPEAVELHRELGPEGSVTFVIPPEALDHEIRFRADALDRAGNLGMAYSYALQVAEHTVADAGDANDPTGGAEGPAPDHASVTPDTSAELLAERSHSGPVEQPRVEFEPGRSTDANQSVAGGTAPDAGNAVAAAVSADRHAVSGADPDESLTDRADGIEDLVLYGRPAAVPFAAAVARLPATERPLTWDGGQVAAFPSGQGWDNQRATHGLFDAEFLGPAYASNDAAAAGPAADAPPPAAVASVLPDPTAEAMRDDGGGRVVQAAADAAKAPTDAGRADLRSLVREAVSFIDLTRGNGLLIPLPATVEAGPPAGGLATVHPWRILGEVMGSSVQTVWVLPQARLGYELNRLFEGRLLADHPALRPVAEPGAVTRAMAGLSPDGVEADSALAP